MNNFTFHNPTKIVFGKGSIAKTSSLIPKERRILLTYGGGSIKRNGVFDQVARALEQHTFFEFGGIEPNPRYETLMRAVELAKSERADYLLSVGGGSTLDGTKFIASALCYQGDDPWKILTNTLPVEKATPIGCILTLAATGSESNGYAVISRNSTDEKLAFGSPLLYPQFAILDPETTYTLPDRQTANGIVDAFVHVLEQYLTYPVGSPLQDRQAEAILCTLIEEGPKAMANPKDYSARANIMWCATQALNGLISCGVPQDWATHEIGHELTAFYGIDHAQSLAIVLPGMLRHRRQQKGDKIAQFAERVWGVNLKDRKACIDAAIAETEKFFRSLGVGTTLSDHGITQGIERIGLRFEERGRRIGEHGDMGKADIDAILQLC